MNSLQSPFLDTKYIYIKMPRYCSLATAGPRIWNGLPGDATSPHLTNISSKTESTFISTILKKVKFSHTRYRALGPELIPVYRQSARR